MTRKFFETNTVQRLNYFRLGKPETNRIRALKLEMASRIEIESLTKLLDGTKLGAK